MSLKNWTQESPKITIAFGGVHPDVEFRTTIEDLKALRDTLRYEISADLDTPLASNLHAYLVDELGE